MQYNALNNYEIPQSFIQLRNTEPMDDSVEPSSVYGKVEDPNHPLANRGKITADYYDSYAALDSYTKKMAKDFGIDVFSPDYTQPGGGEPFQLAQKMQANIMYAANALKNEFQAEKEMRPQINRGDVFELPGADRSGYYYSNPDNFGSNRLNPDVLEANKELGDTRYTQAESNKVNAAERNPKIKAYSMLRDEALQRGDKVEAMGFQKQIDALLTSVPAVSAKAAFGDDDGGSEKQVSNMMPLFERVTNLTRGAFIDAKPTVIGGREYLSSNSLSGDNYGEVQIPKQDGTSAKIPKIIKQVLKDGEGNVYFKYNDPQIPIEKVSDVNPDEVFRKLVESNSGKYGGAASLPKFYQELENQGRLNANRSVSPDVVFGGNEVVKLAQITPNDPIAKKIATSLEERYKRLISGKSKTFVDSPKGRIVFDYDEDNGIFIENWKDLGYPQKPKNLTKDQYLAIVDESGYLDKLINSAKSPNNATKSPNSALKPLTKGALD